MVKRGECGSTKSRESRAGGVGPQVSCNNYTYMQAIDVGFRNPPAEGPTNALAKPYPVWCAGSPPPVLYNTQLTAPFTGAKGCIQMRYLGAYMNWCNQQWDPTWDKYHNPKK